MLLLANYIAVSEDAEGQVLALQYLARAIGFTDSSKNGRRIRQQ